MITITKTYPIITTNLYMELIKFNKSELSIALQPILSVVERRNALPILLNAPMRFRKDTVLFTTSDIEIR